MFSSHVSVNVIGWKAGQVFERRVGGMGWGGGGQRFTPAKAETARFQSRRGVITPQRSFYRTPKSLPSGRHANRARHPGQWPHVCRPSVSVGGAQVTQQTRSDQPCTRRFSHNTHNGKCCERPGGNRRPGCRRYLANVPQNRYLSGRRPEDHGRYSDT